MNNELTKTLIQDIPNLNHSFLDNDLFINTTVKDEYKSKEEYESEIQKLKEEIIEINKKNEYNMTYLKNMKNDEIKILHENFNKNFNKNIKHDDELKYDTLHQPLLKHDNLSEQDLFKILEEEEDKFEKRPSNPTLWTKFKRKVINIKNAIKQKVMNCKSCK